MLIARLVARMFSVGLIVLAADVVSGQDYPIKPIRIVIAGAGGGNDFVARVLAQGISGPLNQQVIIENRPSGVIPGQTVANAPPDGYTLLFHGGSLWIGQLLYKVPFDPVRDFLPISLASRSPNILVVHPSLPVKSVKELIALAKARPGALNYSSAGTGSSSHLTGELFNAMAGVNIVHIPYKSGSLRMAALIGGEVQLEFATSGSVTPQVKAGKLKALAVTSLQPSALAPGLPTVAASLPGYEMGSVYGLLAPAKTPAAVIQRLNQETVRFLSTADAKERLLNLGVEATGTSPEEFAALIKSEMARLGKVIKDAGIRAD